MAYDPFIPGLHDQKSLIKKEMSEAYGNRKAAGAALKEANDALEKAIAEHFAVWKLHDLAYSAACQQLKTVALRIQVYQNEAARCRTEMNGAILEAKQALEFGDEVLAEAWSKKKREYQKLMQLAEAEVVKALNCLDRQVAADAKADYQNLYEQSRSKIECLKAEKDFCESERLRLQEVFEKIQHKYEAVNNELRDRYAAVKQT